MIEVAGQVGWPQLEGQIRAVTMVQPGQNGTPVYPYEDATISLKEVRFDEVRPTTLYLLRPNLAFQGQLSADLQAQGHDPLELDGALLLDDGSGDQVGLIPPLVEETDEDGQCLVDGAHRSFFGLSALRPSFVAVHIRGVRPDCPVYADTNEWDEIVLYDEVPADPSLKKRYRPNAKGLYRDFSAINGSRMRS